MNEYRGGKTPSTRPDAPISTGSRPGTRPQNNTNRSGSRSRSGPPPRVRDTDFEYSPEFSQPPRSSREGRAQSRPPQPDMYARAPQSRRDTSGTRSGYGAQGYSRTPEPKKKSRHLPVWLLVVIDLIAVGLCLCVFAYFHHVEPIGPKAEPVKLPVATPSANAGTPAQSDVENPDDQSGDAALSGEPAAHKFKDKFSAEPEYTENGYRDNNVSIALETRVENGVTWYVADIYVRDVRYLRTHLDNPEYSRGATASKHTYELAQDVNAIVAITGDYMTNHVNGGVFVRNGVMYDDTIDYNCDICVIGNDGVMTTYSPDEFDVEALRENGAWQAWSFGPMLLNDGQKMVKEEFNSTLRVANPRSAIGYYEPGHYALVVVDGRQEHSAGMSTEQMSTLFYDMGCVAAYNFDGGASAAMAYRGETYSKPNDGGRPVSDIVYVNGEMG